MIIVLSPAKTLDFAPHALRTHTLPRQINNSYELINILKQLSSDQLANLMTISEQLSQLNWQRYRDFHLPFTLHNAKQALLVFKGDVYRGIGCEHYTTHDFAFAQQHIRILSGLYGVLRPLDLIQPYRLEMGTRLQNNNGKNLYEYWGEQVTKLLNQDIAQDSSDDKIPLLVNLASQEYFKVIRPNILRASTLAVDFKENKNGTYKTIGIYAKRARGLMTCFIIKNRITTASPLKTFSEAGYMFNQNLSTEKTWVFSRG